MARSTASSSWRACFSSAPPTPASPGGWASTPERRGAGASFSVDAGTVVALLGPNGAGKTTTFMCILGVTGFEGTIEVDGLSVRERGKDVRRRLGYLPQTPALRDGDTCRQGLGFLAGLQGSEK